VPELTDDGDGSLSIPVLEASNLRDAPGGAAVSARRTVFSGRVWSVDTDTVTLTDGQIVDRDVLRHPGAVAVLALDDHERLVLVQQYRHPLGALLWEAPAGLRDAPGEPLQQTAERELAEETGLAAARWEPLLDLALSPGGSDERIGVFLARGLRTVERETSFVATGEEATMVVGRFALDDVVDAVLDGRVGNATLAAGALAVHARLRRTTVRGSSPRT
jgi:8-oxo-dGTP pyrophosphatase MutT (NUDIX family)